MTNNDGDFIESIERKKKKPWLAGTLNGLLVGAGYVYCDRWPMGLVAFICVTALGYFIIISGEEDLQLLPLIVWVILIADGVIAADRYNQKMYKDELEAREADLT